MAESFRMPLDFKHIRAAFPVDLDRQLGYFGNERFVAFWWDSEEDEAVWRDPKHAEPQACDWETFIRYVGPIAPYFRATFGRMDEPADHWFIWDRAEQAAYIATVEAAGKFIANPVSAGDEV